MNHQTALGLLVTAISLLNLVNGSPCDLTSWSGTWFQSGVGLTEINDDVISTKGHCIHSDGNKYIFAQSDEGMKIYRCVIITEKHRNVLQYKESVLQYKETLVVTAFGDADNNPEIDACSAISEDAVIYTLIRVDAEPVDCPFSGVSSFTYNRGYGDCKSPVSTVHSCIEDWKMFLHFSACPDVERSEDNKVELQCYATWNEGSSNFMFGKLLHSGAGSNDDSYRCFIYDESKTNPKEFLVAVSGDATCHGLSTPTAGAVTLVLKKEQQEEACRFPSWIIHSSSWQEQPNEKAEPLITLQVSTNSTIHTFVDGMENVIAMLTCEKVAERRRNVGAYVTRVIKDCETNYMCILFEQQRDGTVVAHFGNITASKNDACEAHFSRDKASKSILVGGTKPRSSTDCSPSFLAPSTLLETEETKKLSILELQRLVLLEHLKVLRMQKKALCEERASRSSRRRG